MKKNILLSLVLNFLLISLFAQTKPCAGDHFRAFDFWIGDWQVLNSQNGAFAGYSSIEVMLDSCVLLENWYGSGPSVGKSFNHYDVRSGMWKQKWLDNFASNIEFTGTIKNDTAHYYNTLINPQNGTKIFNRMMIAKVSDNEVHQIWEQSQDSITWTSAFDGQYIRIPSSYDAMISPDLDSVYMQFAEAYRTLNPQLVTDLYHDNSLYLSQGGAINEGLDAVNNNFTSFFNWVKEEGRSMEIEFLIISRDIEKNMASDVGYYLLTYSQDGEKKENCGKFSTVLKPDADGQWKFLVDSYNDAPVEVFKKVAKDNGHLIR